MNAGDIRRLAIERVAKSRWEETPQIMGGERWEDVMDSRRAAYLWMASRTVDALGDLLPVGESWGCDIADRDPDHLLEDSPDMRWETPDAEILAGMQRRDGRCFGGGITHGPRWWRVSDIPARLPGDAAIDHVHRVAVAIVHALRSSAHGNSELWGLDMRAYSIDGSFNMYLAAMNLTVELLDDALLAAIGIDGPVFRQYIADIERGAS